MIVKGSHQTEYASIPNHIWQRRTWIDESGSEHELGFQAKGLLAYLLSLPGDWEIHVAQLKEATGFGRNKVYDLLNELIASGFAERGEQSRNAAGQMSAASITIFAHPKELGSKTAPRPENRDTVAEGAEPCPRNRDTVNRDTYKETLQQIPPEVPPTIKPIDQEVLKPDDTPPVSTMSDRQRREALKATFAKGAKEPTVARFLQQVWPGTHRSDETPVPAFVAYGLLSDDDRQALEMALPLYRIKLADQDRKYWRSLKKFITERGWTAITATADDHRKAQEMAGREVVNSAKHPALFQRCVDLLPSDDRARQVIESTAPRAWMFPAEIVERARTAAKAGE